MKTQIRWIVTTLMLVCATSARATTFNVEIDYMLGGSPNHSHYPSDAELAAVVRMFACQGHTLNLIRSDQIPHYDNLISDPDPNPNTNQGFFNYSGAPNSFGKLRQLYFQHAGQAGWHYCIFCHNYNGSGSSGLAETPGGNLVVSLGSFANQIGTPFDRAATLAHEFGPNLGLTHCGNMNCGLTGTFVPIVPSIMTYFFQLQGVRTNLICQGLTVPNGAWFKELDYSHGAMCGLYEVQLDETFGTGMIGVDWNCNGQIQGTVSQVIRGNEQGWCGAGGLRLNLSDYDEWSNLTDVTFARPADQMKNMPVSTCITAEEALTAERSSCPQPTLTSEACIAARMVYLRPGGPQFPSGTCSSPYSRLTDAVNSGLPAGSIIFVNGGTFTEPGIVTLSTPMTIYGTSLSTISH
jgi:hypothetical protein